ncbi:MAG TPA: alpha/beta fold hydrolase, partial [Vicinamibacterales bacterium]|nr:alpha/beta fold hydrolase [Vicinamibacterales bacterium]
MVGARVTPLLLVLLLGSQQLPPTGAATAPQLALVPCNLDGVPGPVRCGSYSVWENRAAKAGRRIELSIIVLGALKTSRPDPFVMLQGGPGDAPSFNARFYSSAFGAIRQTRDIVLIDLRGTGKSAALTCPELSRPGADGTFDADILSGPAVRACRERLSTNHDLRFYTTEIAVDDLEEVRQALTYGPINIYGTSYGTRVAQVYMRRHPQSLRAVVMKGLVPPSMAAPASHAPAGETAWQSLVARCARDPECAHHFPTIDADFRQLLSRLEKSSPVLAVPGSPDRAATGVRVTRALFAEAFRSVLYTPEGSAQAPSLVRQLLGGDERTLAERALATRQLFGGERLAAGFFLSVSCAEDIPFLPADADARAEAAFGGTYRLDQ